VTHDIHLTDDMGAHETARSLVTGGAENAPCRFFREGRHVMSHASLYRCASTTVREEPTLSTVRWHPHPKAVVSDRLREVVAAEHAAMDAARAAKRRAA
jgi:hypothetical protein